MIQDKQLYRHYLSEYLQTLGIDVKRPFRCLNPDHEDKNPSMSYNAKKQQVHCFSCGVSYDLYDLLCLQYGLPSFKDALDKAASLFGAPQPEKNANSMGESQQSNFFLKGIAAFRNCEDQNEDQVALDQGAPLCENKTAKKNLNSVGESQRSSDFLSKGIELFRNCENTENIPNIFDKTNDYFGSVGSRQDVTDADEAQINNFFLKGIAAFQNCEDQNEDQVALDQGAPFCETKLSKKNANSMGESQQSSDLSLKSAENSLNRENKEDISAVFDKTNDCFEPVGSKQDVTVADETQINDYFLKGTATSRDCENKKDDRSALDQDAPSCEIKLSKKNANSMGESQVNDFHIQKNITFQKFENTENYIQTCADRFGEQDYLQKRGISAAICQKFNIGYDPEFYAGRDQIWRVVVFPKGESCFSVRNIDPLADKDQRYRKSAGSSPIFLAEFLKFDQPVFVVEGEIDALSICELGYCAVALGNARERKKILELASTFRPDFVFPLLLALDNDNVGRDASDALQSELEALKVHCRVVDICMGEKDPNAALTVDRKKFALELEKAVELAELKTPKHQMPLNGSNFAYTPSYALGSDSVEYNSLNAVQVELGALKGPSGNDSIYSNVSDESDPSQDPNINSKADLEKQDLTPENNISISKDLNNINEFYQENNGFEYAHKHLREAEKEIKKMAKTDNYETDFNEITKSSTVAFYTSAFEKIDHWLSSLSSQKTDLQPTGFGILDEIFSGGLRSGFYVFGAMSAVGKTSFVLQMADQIAAQGRPVLFFSLEMSGAELLSKSLSRLSFLSSPDKAFLTHDISNHGDDPQLMDAIDKYKSFAENLYIIEAEKNFDFESMERSVGDFCKSDSKRKRPVVIVDYLQLIAPVGGLSDKQAIDRTVLALKRISRDYGIPVVAVSSLNRQSYSKPIGMESFKESGAIEYSSDVLIGLQHRGMGTDRFDFDAAQRRDPRQVELCILKNRNGPAGQCLGFDYYAQYHCFFESQIKKDEKKRRF